MKTVTIPEVHLAGTVHGQSLQACVNKAIEQCELFYGTEREYTLEPMHCEPVTLVGGNVLHYEARFQAHAA